MRKEAMTLKEIREGYKKSLEGRKGREKYCNYNLKNFEDVYIRHVKPVAR